MIRLVFPDVAVLDGARLWIFREDGTILCDVEDASMPLAGLTAGPLALPQTDLRRSHPQFSKEIDRLRSLPDNVTTPFAVLATEVLLFVPDLAEELDGARIEELRLKIAVGGAGAPDLKRAIASDELRVPSTASLVPSEDDPTHDIGIPIAARTRKLPPTYRDSPLPRLETSRSRRMAKDPGATFLHRPGVEPRWDRRFRRFFVLSRSAPGGNGPPRLFRESTVRFLGWDTLVGRPNWGTFLMDESQDLDELRAKRIRGRGFKKTRSMSHPAETETDEWLVDRILNGFHPAYFRGKKGGPYRIEFNWNAYDFAKISAKAWDKLSHEANKDRYELPNLVAAFEEHLGSLRPTEIRVQYRKRSDYQGPIKNASQLEAEIAYTPNSAQWSYARRLLRCQLALSGEMDHHLARGHLLTEQYLAALRTQISSSHPLYDILHRYLSASDGINAYGDVLIMGDTGALANLCALSDASIVRRLVEQVGGLDWKDWKPREPVVASHRYAKAALLYWEKLRPVVRSLVHGAWIKIEDRWAEVERFSNTLVKRSPQYKPYLGVPLKEWRDTNEFIKDGRPGGTPAMSPLPPRAAGVDARRDALVQLCTHAIFHATFFHTWTNDRQFEDLGDPRFASFGLMSAEPIPVNPTPLALHEWHLRSDPLVRDAGFQMVTSRILTHMDYGHMMVRKKGAGAPCLREKKEPVEIHEDLRMVFCKAEAEFCSLNDERERHPRDRVDIKNFRSRTNT